MAFSDGYAAREGLLEGFLLADRENELGSPPELEGPPDEGPPDDGEAPPDDGEADADEPPDDDPTEDEWQDPMYEQGGDPGPPDPGRGIGRCADPNNPACNPLPPPPSIALAGQVQSALGLARSHTASTGRALERYASAATPPSSGAVAAALNQAFGGVAPPDLHIVQDVVAGMGAVLAMGQVVIASSPEEAAAYGAEASWTSGAAAQAATTDGATIVVFDRRGDGQDFFRGPSGERSDADRASILVHEAAHHQRDEVSTPGDTDPDVDHSRTEPLDNAWNYQWFVNLVSDLPVSIDVENDIGGNAAR